MLIRNNNINFETKEQFLGPVGLGINDADGNPVESPPTLDEETGFIGNIPWRAFVSIQDTNEIWTHGVFIGGNLRGLTINIGGELITIPTKLSEFENDLNTDFSHYKPLDLRTFTGLYYGANSYNSGVFELLNVKPKDTTKLNGYYYIKFTMETQIEPTSAVAASTAATYRSYKNWSICELWFNRIGTMNCYKIWNARVNSYAHYYLRHSYVSSATNADFNNFGVMLGVGVESGNNYNSSNYPRTTTIYIQDVSDDLEYTFVDNTQPILQYGKSVWYNTVKLTRTPAITYYDAVTVGLLESGDANTVPNQTYNTSDSNRIYNDYIKGLNYLLYGYNKQGLLLPFGQTGASGGSETRIKSIDEGTWITGKEYKIGDYIKYLNSSNVILGYYRCIKLHTSSSSIIPTNTTYWQTYKVYNTQGIDYTRSIYYLSTTVNSGAFTYPTKYYSISGIDLRYTFNCVASNTETNTLGLIQDKSIYIRGYIDDNNLFYIYPTTIMYSNNPYDKCWAQDIPEEEESVTIDGHTYPITYWYVGKPYYNGSYSTRGYQINLDLNNPMYWYHNGMIQEYDPCKWEDIDNKPTLLSQFTDDITLKESLSISPISVHIKTTWDYPILEGTESTTGISDAAWKLSGTNGYLNLLGIGSYLIQITHLSEDDGGIYSGYFSFIPSGVGTDEEIILHRSGNVSNTRLFAKLKYINSAIYLILSSTVEEQECINLNIKIKKLL